MNDAHQNADDNNRLVLFRANPICANKSRKKKLGHKSVIAFNISSNVEMVYDSLTTKTLIGFG